MGVIRYNNSSEREMPLLLVAFIVGVCSKISVSNISLSSTDKHHDVEVLGNFFTSIFQVSISPKKSLTSKETANNGSTRVICILFP